MFLLPESLRKHQFSSVTQECSFTSSHLVRFIQSVNRYKALTMCTRKYNTGNRGKICKTITCSILQNIVEGQRKRTAWAREARESFTERVSFELGLERWKKIISRAFLVRGTAQAKAPNHGIAGGSVLEGGENKSQEEKRNQSRSLQGLAGGCHLSRNLIRTIADDNSNASNSLFSKGLRLLLKVKDE